MSGLYQQSVIDTINHKLDIRRLMQVIDYRFEKYQENSRGIKGFCPIHREGIFRNLIINSDTRTFHCQYNQCPGNKGGTLIDLYAQALKISNDEAVRQISQDQKLDVNLHVNEENIIRSVTEASTIGDSGNLDEAETRLLAVIKASPETFEAYESLLKVYESTGDTEKRNNTLISLCRLKVAQGKAADVSDLIQEWAEISPDSQEARSANAEVTLAGGEVENAVLEFMGAADAYEMTGEFEDALKAYRRAEQISLENQVDVIETTPHIIRLLHQLRRHDEANTYLVNLANISIARDDYAHAVELLIPTISIPETPPETLRQFLDIVFNVPINTEIADAIYTCSEIFIRSEDRTTAIQALEKLHQRIPQNEQAVRRLVNEYYNVGKTPQALDLEAELAVILYDSGRQKDAYEITDKVLTWQPAHIRMLETLETFQTIENKTIEATETKRRLIRSLLEHKAYDAALEQVNALITKQPDNEDFQDLKSRALEGAASSGDKTLILDARIYLETLADKCLEATNGKRACDYLERAAKLYDPPTHDVLFKLARAYLRNKRLDMARDNVILACEYLTSLDRLDEAILDAERYSNLMPEESDLVRYLAELYLRFDDKNAAVARLKRLSDDLEAAGRIDEAREVLKQAREFEPQTAQELIRQANEFLDENKTEKYIQSMTRAATLYLNEGKKNDAAETYIQLLSKRPEHTASAETVIPLLEDLLRQDEARRWTIHLARAFSRTDKKKSISYLNNILTTKPGDEESLELLYQYQFQNNNIPAGIRTALELAHIYSNAKRIDHAKKVLIAALDESPDSVELLTEMLTLLNDGKNNLQAITWGRKLITALTNIGNLDNAANIYEQLISLDPNNLQLQLEQLHYLQSNKREDLASPVREKLADIYIQQERFSDAESLLGTTADKSPRDIATRKKLIELYTKTNDKVKAESQKINLAGIYNLDGNTSDAITTLEDVIDGNNENFDARRQLIQIYRASGQTANALNQLEALADAYRNLNLDLEAVAVEKEIVEMSPSDSQARERLANSLVHAGNIPQACEELEKIARDYDDANDSEQALATIESILKLDPNRLPARKIRADIYTKQGDTEMAIAELRSIADIAAGSFSSAFPPLHNNAHNSHPIHITLQLVKEYDFNRFVVGAKNDFAYATALAIARSPARAYNPFFLYADVGLGKTHLCNAIANHILENDMNARVLYTNSEDFTGELVEAIQNNAIQQFRNRYRSLDLLIVDDVQFLAGKERAQEEFFHIFNALFQAKKQIVITSDRPPAEISHLESRLRSRFGAGVIVDIAPPDLETRSAILLREMKNHNLKLEPWIATQLAEHVTTNVRDLKSALNQVVALRDLKKSELTKESIQKMLNQLFIKETEQSQT